MWIFWLSGVSHFYIVAVLLIRPVSGSAIGPVLTIMRSNDTSSIVEGSNLNLVCNLEGVPKRSYFYLTWNRGGTVIARLFSEGVCPDDVRWYAVNAWQYSMACPSMATFVLELEGVNRMDNGSIWSCGIELSTGEYNSNIFTIQQVDYVANVSVATVVSNRTLLSLRCDAQGVPDTYIYTGWRQVWPRYGVVKEWTGRGAWLNISLGTEAWHKGAELNASLNTEAWLEGAELNTSEDAEVWPHSSQLTYESSGIYSCLVSNGVTDYKTGCNYVGGSTTVLAESKPVITSPMKSRDEALIIPYPTTKSEGITFELEFYSNTKATQVQIYDVLNGIRQSIAIWQTRLFVPTVVVLDVHSHKVKVNGSKVMVNIAADNSRSVSIYDVIVSNRRGAGVLRVHVNMGAADDKLEPESSLQLSGLAHTEGNVGGIVAAVCAIVAIATVIIVTAARMRNSKKDSRAEGTTANRSSLVSVSVRTRAGRRPALQTPPLGQGHRVVNLNQSTGERVTATGIAPTTAVLSYHVYDSIDVDFESQVGDTTGHGLGVNLANEASDQGQGRGMTREAQGRVMTGGASDQCQGRDMASEADDQGQGRGMTREAQGRVMTGGASDQGQGRDMVSEAGDQGQGRDMTREASDQGQGREMTRKAGDQGQGSGMIREADDQRQENTVEGHELQGQGHYTTDHGRETRSHIGESGNSIGEAGVTHDTDGHRLRTTPSGGADGLPSLLGVHDPDRAVVTGRASEIGLNRRGTFIIGSSRRNDKSRTFVNDGDTRTAFVGNRNSRGALVGGNGETRTRSVDHSDVGGAFAISYEDSRTASIEEDRLSQLRPCILDDSVFGSSSIEMCCGSSGSLPCAANGHLAPSTSFPADNKVSSQYERVVYIQDGSKSGHTDPNACGSLRSTFDPAGNGQNMQGCTKASGPDSDLRSIWHTNTNADMGSRATLHTHADTDDIGPRTIVRTSANADIGPRTKVHTSANADIGPRTIVHTSSNANLGARSTLHTSANAGGSSSRNTLPIDPNANLGARSILHTSANADIGPRTTVHSSSNANLGARSTLRTSANAGGSSSRTTLPTDPKAGDCPTMSTRSSISDAYTRVYDAYEWYVD